MRENTALKRTNVKVFPQTKIFYPVCPVMKNCGQTMGMEVSL